MDILSNNLIHLKVKKNQRSEKNITSEQQKNLCHLQKQPQEIEIRIDQWEFLGKGQTHLILQHIHLKAGDRQPIKSKKKMSDIENKQSLQRISPLKIQQSVLIINFKQALRNQKEPNANKSFSKSKQIQRALYSLAEEIYHQFLQMLFKGKNGENDMNSFKKMLFKSQIYHLQDKNSERRLKQIINQREYLKYKISEQENGIISNIKIGENLLSRDQFKWDFCIQLKPKTILPEIYTKNLIEQVYKELKKSQSFEFSQKQVVEMLNSASFQEKLRYFKKNLYSMKKYKPNQSNQSGLQTAYDQLSKKKKFNEEPLKIFDKFLLRDKNSTKESCQQVPKYLKAKGLKACEISLEQNIQNALNLAIHKILHHEFQEQAGDSVLNQIFLFQSLFIRPISQLNYKIIQNVTNQQYQYIVSSKGEILKQLIEEYHNNSLFKVMQMFQDKKKQQAKCCLTGLERYMKMLQKKSFIDKLCQIDQKQPEKSQQKYFFDEFIKIVKILISHTWKDVSVFVRGKFCENIKETSLKYQNLQLKSMINQWKVSIIDWDLKDFQTVKKNQKKEKALLKNYIKSKFNPS